MTVRTTLALGAALFLGIAVGTGCKTTQEQEGHPSQRSGLMEPTSGSKAESLGWLADHKLSQAASQEVYLKILGTELDSGSKVPKDQMHTNKGLLTCRKNIDHDACTVRGRLSNLALSGEQFVELPVNQELSSFVRAARRDIPADLLLLADLECDYLGQNSPPFGLERAACRAQNPRRLEEIVFGGVAAETLAQSLRGEDSLGSGQKTLKGAMSCHLGDLEHRIACFLRSMPDKSSSERVVELPRDQILSVARKVELAIADNRKLKGEESTASRVSTPLDVTLSLECQVDSSLVENGGERVFQCLGRL